MNRTEKLLTVLAVLFGAAFAALTAFYYDIYPLLPIIDILIWLPIAGELIILIIGILKLVYSLQEPEAFSTRILIPMGAAVVCGVLALMLADPINSYQSERSFQARHDAYDACVQYLDSVPFTDNPVLPQEYAYLSADGRVKAFDCDGNICYLFLRLDHAGRDEGVLYVSGKAPVIYYEIVDRYRSYGFKQLAPGYVWIVLYK